MKCKANICLCHNDLEAFLQKSVRIYAIKSNLLDFIRLMNDEKKKIYINIGKKCKKCKEFFQFLTLEMIIALHFIPQKCKESVRSVRRSVSEEVLP